MRIPRVYQGVDLTLGQTLALSAEAAQHLIKVLRLQSGAQIDIFNGQGEEARAIITSTTNKQCQVKIESCSAISVESPLSIHLAVALIRNEKMDFMIQKAVELGVTQITPLITQYSNLKIHTDSHEKKLKHWQGIIISACEQCGRNQLPIIHEPQRYQVWLEKTSVGTDTLGLILHPYTDNTLGNIDLTPKAINLLIGPEGGFSDEEVDLAQQQGFMPIKFGPRILRAETAAIAILSVLQLRWGDL